MHYHDLHSWNVTPQEARVLQDKLCSQVIKKDDFKVINTVAGVDIGFKQNIAHASVIVLSYPELQIVDGIVTQYRVSFPYIPGILSYREMPPLLVAFAYLKTVPDLIIVDGQGIAHPRRLGLASHLGLFVDIPTIGCAKSRLCGTYTEPGIEKGCYSYLKDGTEIIGAVLRTRTKVNPVFVSVGHRISLNSAIKITLDCSPKFRLPETTRYAHKASAGDVPPGVTFIDKLHTS
ncbi:deoxyribonuclease V [Candidatus Poribacteria bacterium]|nr:deoxyribonuclease V [Candidatus Poribacteria bacterium]